MHFRQSLAAPITWCGRALFRNGPERAAVLQVLKAALAAVIAWVVAADVLRLPQPFLAPYAAVFVVEATVYRSARNAVQQFAALVGAVAVAAVVGHLIPSITLALAAAVAAGLLIGQWRRLGDAGPWVGITALVIVTFGQATEASLLLARVVESALGVVIGTAVNAVVFPPVYADGARRATERLAAEMAELVTAMADGLRHADISGHTGEWVRRSYDLTGLVTEAEQAVSWSRESRRLNIRGRIPRRRTPISDYRFSLAGLRASAPYLQTMADALHTTVETGRFVPGPTRESRVRFAELLDSLAAVVRLRADTTASDDDVTEALARARRLLDDLDDRVLTAPGEAFGSAVGLASLLMPARRSLRELEAH